MSGVPLWQPSFPGVDSFVLGGDTCPGQAIITGGNKTFEWQVNKALWMSGATVAPLGDNLAEFDILVGLWDPADWVPWLAFAHKYLSTSVVTAPGGLGALALGIEHPVLNCPPLNIDKVVVKSVSPMVNDGTGYWSCTIKFLQYRKPKVALGRPNAAIPAAAVAKPTAQDAQEQKIQALQAQAAAAGGAP